MNQQMLREQLKKGKIDNQYLLVGTEPILFDNTILSVKELLMVNESFDYDRYSAAETPFEEIIPRLYLAPFGSNRRLVVIKNLEELDSRTLATFAASVSKVSSNNCLILTYLLDKSRRKGSGIRKRFAGMFKNATCVDFQSDASLIRKWIIAKIKRDKLNFSPRMAHYLEEEFSDDITGLKNEFDKIENYLYEAKTIDAENMKDLAQGLSEINKYEIVDAYLKGSDNTIPKFEMLQPYLRNHAEIVSALVHGLVYHTQRSASSSNLNTKSAMHILDEITKIDSRVKKGSFFPHVMLELFFLKNARFFKKGATNGR